MIRPNWTTSSKVPEFWEEKVLFAPRLIIDDDKSRSKTYPKISITANEKNVHRVLEFSESTDWVPANKK